MTDFAKLIWFWLFRVEKFRKFSKKASIRIRKRPNDLTRQANRKKPSESLVATGLFPLAAPARGPRPELFSLADRWNTPPPLGNALFPLATLDTVRVQSSSRLPSMPSRWSHEPPKTAGHLFPRLSASSSRLPVPGSNLPQVVRQSKSKSVKGPRVSVRLGLICAIVSSGSWNWREKRSISRGTPPGISGWGVQGLEVKGATLAGGTSAASIGKSVVDYSSTASREIGRNISFRCAFFSVFMIYCFRW